MCRCAVMTASETYLRVPKIVRVWSELKRILATADPTSAIGLMQRLGVLASVLAEAWRSFASAEADVRALVPKVTAPILYTWARHDALVAWSRCRGAALKASRSEVLLFDAGHAAFLEQPEAFDAAFRRFAAQLPA